MSRDYESDIIGTRPAFAEGLFAPVAAMPGAGQQARAEAREKARGGIEAAHRQILEALRVIGPLTRKELASATGMMRDTINWRVGELRDQARVYTDGRRNGESIVRLAGAA